MRWPAAAEHPQTRVMREMLGRSDPPTVTEEILIYRRNNDATRVSTPGLSST